MLPIARRSITIPVGIAQVVRTISVLVRSDGPSGGPVAVRLDHTDCPAGTVGAPRFGPSGFGDDERLVGLTPVVATVPLTIASAAFTSPTAKSPHRCTATIRVSYMITPGDPNPTNNTFPLVIDVIDRNDF
jgi:hypothetical protein